MIRRCTSSDLRQVHAVINDAAQAYKGFIPDACWHEPYMTLEELEAETRDGVVFWSVEDCGRLIGVMGIQDKAEVVLIRHAYVKKLRQRVGVGTRLLAYLEGLTAKPILIGTWQAARWTIDFFESHGYSHQSREDTDRLLRMHCRLAERQIESSIVLAKPAGEGL